ncbi:MAG: formate dehydrogenase subunit gamma, partial [Alphaproteobacteria bacterium]|nr:formate dehydrogenase subunit gamma [Alphaproteobacteria bacterium]
IVALLMVALIMGHIYIGSVGMEDAFSAMWSGMVDRNWLKEHHSVWYRKVVDRREGDRDEKGGEPHRQPAE